MIARLLLLLLLLFPARALAYEVQSFTTPAGIPVWLAADTSVPVLSVAFTFRGGSALDPPDKAGLANLALALLTEGTAAHPGAAFLQQLHDASVDLSFSAGRDGLNGTMRTLKETQNTAFSLLAEALTAPELSGAALERIRAETLARIKHEQQDLSWHAFRTLYAGSFAGHAYAAPPLGTPQTLANITRADVQEFLRGALVRQRLMVAAAGDISPTQLAALVDRAFGSLAAGVPAAELPRVTLPGVLTRWHIDRPGAQSVVVLAGQGVAPQDPDAPAAEILDYVFGGGGFQSRLMKSLRGESGLTYGVHSSFVAFERAELFFVQTAVQPRNAAPTLEYFRKNWAQMARGITAEELHAAQDYLVGALDLDNQSTGRIAALLLETQRLGFTPDYLNQRAARLRAVTLADTARVARRLFGAAPFLALVAGPAPGWRADETRHAGPDGLSQPPTAGQDAP